MLLCRRFFLACLLSVLSVSFVQAADEPEKIALDKAADHVGKEVTLEFKVESAHYKEDSKNPCFLNSKASHKDKDNFTIVIFPDTVAKFKEAGIADPSTHFAGKTITIQGKIESRMDKLQIVVKAVKQITLKAAE